jgi:outer membrane protein assembly factor BamD (BamD/ComL family)
VYKKSIVILYFIIIFFIISNFSQSSADNVSQTSTGNQSPVITTFQGNVEINFGISGKQFDSLLRQYGNKDNAVNQLLKQLSIKAEKYKSKLFDTSPLKRLKVFQNEIYLIGRLVQPNIAYNLIIDFQKKYNIPEISPVLLMISKATLESIIKEPFNYSFPIDSNDVYSPMSSWTLNSASDDIILDRIHLSYLSKEDLNYKYKDFIYFLQGNFKLLLEQYPNSFLIDAALYAQIRQFIFIKDYDTAIRYANKFISEYPNHRHLDDAYVLKVISQQLAGKAMDAFYTTLIGQKQPDGDMSDWLEMQLFQIAERFLTKEELYEIINKNIVPDDLLLILKYTYAHHIAAEKDYQTVHDFLSSLQEDLKHKQNFTNSDKKLVKSIQRYIKHDLKLFSKLSKLKKDNSLNGLYKLGLYYFNNDLVHYNQIFTCCDYPYYPSRRDIYMESRTNKKYFEKRNNLYLASKIFEDIAQKTDNLILKQKSLYKLARCYQRLSYSFSFFHDQLDYKDRETFKNLSLEIFQSAYEIYKNGHIADDSLAEAGYIAWFHLNNIVEAKRLLKKVINEYPNKNAEDNAVYLLALIYESEGDMVNALKYYIKLGKICVSHRFKDISNKKVEEIKPKVSP